MARSESALRILHADDHLVAVSKPSGMFVHRTELGPDRTVVVQTLAAQLGRRVWPVHRLDRAASGVLLLGLSPADVAAAQRALQAESARKEYLVLVRWPQRTFPLADRWECTRPLRDDAGTPRPCRTEFAVVEHLGACAVVRARIHTGRRHQIRRHLNHCARHALGDTTHGKGRINREFRERHDLGRLFLHAERVALDHPGAGARTEIVDPLPPELSRVLESVRAAQRP